MIGRSLRKRIRITQNFSTLNNFNNGETIHAARICVSDCLTMIEQWNENDSDLHFSWRLMNVVE